MRNKNGICKGIKITALLTVPVLILNLFPFEAKAATESSGLETVTLKSQIVSKNAPNIAMTKTVFKDTEIFELENKYLVIRERKSFGEYIITVLDKNTCEQINFYSIKFKGSGWDSWSYSKSRYQIVRRIVAEGSNSYYTYLVDLVSGNINELPIMSVDSNLILPPESLYVRDEYLRMKEVSLQNGGNIYNTILFRDSDKYIVYNLEKESSATLGFADTIKPFGWNSDGTYLAFVDNSNLKLYNSKTDEVQTIVRNQDGNAGFLTWCPDGKGFFFYIDGRLKYMKMNGEVSDIGSYEPVLDGPPEKPSLAQWNPALTKVAIQDKTSKIYLIDISKDDVRIIDKPESDFDSSYGAGLMDIFWTPDGTDIKFMSYRSMGKMQYINDDLYIKNQQGNFELISVNGADDFTYYKHYILFLSDISMMGSYDKFAQKLGVYNLNSGKLTYIDDIEKYEITPDNNSVILYKNIFNGNGAGYLLDENTMEPGKTISGVYWGAIKTVGGRFVFQSLTPNGEITFSVLDSSKMQTNKILSFNDKEQYFVTGNEKVMAFYVPSRKKIFFYNGVQLSSIDITGKLVAEMFGYPLINSDGTIFCYIEELQGTYSLKLEKIPFPTVGQKEPSQQVKILFNDRELRTDVAPVIKNGRAMVPLRSLAEACGVEISWENREQAVNLKKDSGIIQLTIGKEEATFNNDSFTLEAAPFITEGRTMVPLRFITEAFGAAVTWDDSTKTAYVKYPIE